MRIVTNILEAKLDANVAVVSAVSANAAVATSVQNTFVKMVRYSVATSWMNSRMSINSNYFYRK